MLKKAIARGNKTYMYFCLSIGPNKEAAGVFFLALDYIVGHNFLLFLLIFSLEKVYSLDSVQMSESERSEVTDVSVGMCSLTHCFYLLQ